MKPRPPTGKKSAPQPSRPGRDLWILGAASLVLLLVYHRIYAPFFPNQHGRLGHDYSYFLPLVLAGDFWFQTNGLFHVPWFTPAFCGGVPLLPNPQSVYYSVPQFLAFVVDPLRGVYVSFLIFAWLGFAGFALLLVRAFRTGWPAALLGGTAFMFNGFYPARLIIGHLTFQAFMLVPLLAWLLLRPLPEAGLARTWRFALDVVAAAVVWGYMVMSGMFNLIAPAAVTVVVIGLIHSLMHSRRSDFWARLTASGILGLGLCSAKLLASFAYVNQFPRSDYPLPGAHHVFDVVTLLFRALFLSPPYQEANRIMFNAQWTLQRHELEYGVGLVPLALVVLAIVIGIGRASAGSSRLGFDARVAIGLALIAVLMAIPIAVNVYTPSWNGLLKHLWLFKNSSTLTRWFCVFIPVVVLLAGLSIERLFASPSYRAIGAVAASALCLGLHAGEDRESYQSESFDPRPAIALHLRVHEAHQPIPPIDRILDVDQNGLVIGASPLECYEALFGYRLEHFPKQILRSGPALESIGDRLNVKDPACYVFPGANGCRPGDHFTAARRNQANAFLHYRPYDFHLPLGQRIVDALNLILILGVAGFFAAYGIVAPRLRRRSGTRPRPSPGRASRPQPRLHTL